MPRERRAHFIDKVHYPTLHQSPDPIRAGDNPISHAAWVDRGLSGYGLSPEREDATLLGGRIALIPGARPSTLRPYVPEREKYPQHAAPALAFSEQVAAAQGGFHVPAPLEGT